MEFERIHSLVGHVPYILERNGRHLYDLILREGLTNILELGIAHGTATCYMAAALEELGEGLVTAVDLVEAKGTFDPSAEEQLEKVGLSKFARVVRMQSGYTWFLHDEIRRNTEGAVCKEILDLCIIDGPKNWTIDGAAFFMVDKLLKKDGWIIFDDYDWTYDSVDGRRESTDGITHRQLSKDERSVPHVREIFELLVKQHPHYGELLVLAEDDWALARKTMSESRTYELVYRETGKDLLAKLLRGLRRRIFKGGRS